jgi:hypothetical protein
MEDQVDSLWILASFLQSLTALMMARGSSSSGNLCYSSFVLVSVEIPK